MSAHLTLPNRTQKPRTDGLTSILDNGLPAALLEAYIKSSAGYIDYVKFGWGTALVSIDIQEKIRCCEENQIGFYLGGTLFEKYYHENKLDCFVNLCKSLGCQTVEVSNGTIPLGNSDKAKCIHDLSQEFKVFSEVGYKDNRKSIHLPPSKWIEYILQDIDAGSEKVITEARESGNSGICRDNGELRFGLIEDIITHVPTEKLIFEAPNKKLQTFFIRKVGANVNLANISFDELVSVETLRLGLRSETLLDM